MRILVLNSGSSSIKYKLFDMTDRSTLASGLLERIGEATSSLTHRARNDRGETTETHKTGRIPDHRVGMQEIVEALSASGAEEKGPGLDAIGHRVVHGGEDFTDNGKQQDLHSTKFLADERCISIGVDIFWRIIKSEI